MSEHPARRELQAWALDLQKAFPRKIAAARRSQRQALMVGLLICIAAAVFWDKSTDDLFWKVTGLVVLLIGLIVLAGATNQQVNTLQRGQRQVDELLERGQFARAVTWSGDLTDQTSANRYVKLKNLGLDVVAEAEREQALAEKAERLH